MLTIFMECKDHEVQAAQTLATLVAGAVKGLVSDVVILDKGSGDGIATLADAAGARFYSNWEITEILNSARGDWFLFIEPGARPQPGWIEEMSEYVSYASDPASFSQSRTFKKPLFKRFASPKNPMEYGLLISRPQAIARAQNGMGLYELAKGAKARKLRSELVPAWATQKAV